MIQDLDERAIRRDERKAVVAVLQGDDLRRAMRVLAGRLTDLNRDDRQRASGRLRARITELAKVTDRPTLPEVVEACREALADYLGPDLRRLCLLLAALLEEHDPELDNCEGRNR